MNYEQIRYSKPDGIGKNRPYRKLTIYNAIVVFLIQLGLFLTVESLAQYYLGNGGLAITEVMVLAVAVIPVFLLHANPREVFRVEKPRASAVGGALVFLVGAYSLSVIANCLTMLLFPDEYMRIYESSEAVSSSFFIDLLVVCLMPAICEEALHRGFIQNAVSSRVKNLFGQSLIMGAFFAVFHVYPVRYPSMFIMGTALSYVFALTGNMFYSSLMHFSCNLFATVLGYVMDGSARFSGQALTLAQGTSVFAAASESVADSAGLMTLSSFGLILIFYGIPAVFFLYLGEYLIRIGTDPVRPYFIPKDREEAHRILWNRLLTPIIILAAVGIFCFTTGAVLGV